MSYLVVSIMKQSEDSGEIGLEIFVFFCFVFVSIFFSFFFLKKKKRNNTRLEKKSEEKKGKKKRKKGKVYKMYETMVCVNTIRSLNVSWFTLSFKII